MTSPVLMAVDDDPDGLRTLDDALRRRYDRDYLVIGETSPRTALGRLRELRAAGHPVAVLMAASSMAAITFMSRKPSSPGVSGSLSFITHSDR